MKIIGKFNSWQRINEQKGLDVDPKEKRKNKKAKRKKNKRKFRKEDYISDSGATYTLIRQKDSDDTQDTFVLKGKGKDSPVWDEKGIVVKDVNDFLDFELFSGENEGKYDEESVEMEKYREGNRRDRVKFTIKLVDQEKVKAEEEAKKKEEEETKKKAEAEKAAKAAKAITIPKNAEGENRIEVGQTSEILPQIKEMIRKTFVKKGFKIGSNYGMDWLDSDKLEEKDAVWVKALRAGFGMPVKDFISQGLVDKLVAQVAEWEKPAAEEENKDQASNESLIPTFESYMRILEQFDMEAAMKQMQQETPAPATAVKKKKSVSSGTSTGFTKEQGDAFRTWANSKWTKEYYGKPSKFDLDETGSHDNSFIRKALAQAKKDLENQTGPFKGFMFRTYLGYQLQRIIANKLDKLAKDSAELGAEKKEWSRTEEDQKLAEQASQTIVDLFNNSAWFKEFKDWNDNEAGAIAKFSPWWTKNVKPTIDKLNDKDGNKKTLNSLYNTIITKMEGSTGNDTAFWRIWDAKNTTGKRYSVDTDF